MNAHRYVYWFRKGLSLKSLYAILAMTVAIVFFHAFAQGGSQFYSVILEFLSIFILHLVLFPWFLLVASSNNRMFFSPVALTRYKSPNHAYAERLFFLSAEALVFCAIYFVSAVVSMVILSPALFGEIHFLVWILVLLYPYVGFIYVGVLMVVLSKFVGEIWAMAIVFACLSADFIVAAITVIGNSGSMFYGVIKSFGQSFLTGVNLPVAIKTFWLLLAQVAVFVAIGFAKFKRERRMV